MLSIKSRSSNQWSELGVSELRVLNGIFIPFPSIKLKVTSFALPESLRNMHNHRAQPQPAVSMLRTGYSKSGLHKISWYVTHIEVLEIACERSGCQTLVSLRIIRRLPPDG